MKGEFRFFRGRWFPDNVSPRVWLWCCIIIVMVIVIIIDMIIPSLFGNVFKIHPRPHSDLFLGSQGVGRWSRCV